MKLVMYDDYQLGVVEGEQVVNVTKAVGDLPSYPQGQLMIETIAHFEEVRPKIEAAAAKGKRVPVGRVKFLPPLPKPGKIIGIGLNYIEKTRPERGVLDAFVKTPDVVSGSGDTVVLPPFEARTCHPEPEMGFVIGKRARQVSKDDAMDYIFGYLNFIDFSLRLSRPPDIPTLFAHKGSEGFAPIGPAIVTKDEVEDPYKLDVRLIVNENETVYNTDTIAYKFDEIIEWLSLVCTLYPGDIITTGTNHEALQVAREGDRVTLTVEKLGPPLTVHVADTLHRQFDRNFHFGGGQQR